MPKQIFSGNSTGEVQDNVHRLFEAAPVAFVILRGAGHVVEVINDRALHIIGRERKQVVGFPIAGVLPEIVPQGFVEMMDQVYGKGENLVADEAPLRVIRNGIPYETIVKFVFQPIRDEDGMVNGIMIIGDDIGKEVRLRKQVETNEKELQDLVKRAPVSILLLEGEPLVVKVANSSALETMGKNENDVVGRTLSEVFPELPDRKNIYLRVYNSGIPYVGRSVEVRFTKNGKKFTGYYDLNYTPWYDGEGNIKGVMSVGVDVTENVASRKRILESEARVRTIFEQAPVAIAIYKGEDFVVEFANQYMLEFYGKKREEIINRKIFEVFPELAGNGVKDLHMDVLRKGKPFKVQAQKHEYIKNGQQYTGYFDIGFEPMREPSGDVSGLIITGHEVTEQVLAREQIEKTNQQLQFSAALSQHILDAVIGVDMKFNIISWNKGAVEQYGYTEEEVLGRSSADILKTEFRKEGDRQALHEQMEQQGWWRGEVTQERKDGSRIAVMSSLAYVRDEEGGPVAIVAVNRDITENKKIHEEIKRREKQFRTLTETLPQLIWMTDATSKALYTSRRWEEYSGIVPEGFESWAKIVHADDLETINKRWAESLETKNKYHAEARLRRHDGQYRWHSVQGEPIQDQHDEVIGWIGAFNDIHDRKIFTEQLEALVQERTAELSEKNTALENSESFLQQLIDSSIEFISVLDKNLVILTVNKQFESGMGKSKAELEGKHLFEVNPKSENSAQHAAILKALGGETVYLSKRRSIARPDLYVDTYFIPLVRQGRVEGVIIMSRDVSEIVESENLLREKNEALERTNRELESFNYIASHDLQEPLRKIQTFIHFLEKAGDEDSKQKYFKKIVDSSKRMSDLIQSILTYSRLTRSGEDYSEVDLAEIMLQVQGDFELLIEEKQAVIEQSGLTAVRANGLQMNQLFSNLLSNSLKFSREQPHIRIHARATTAADLPEGSLPEHEGKWIRIDFSDNGIGFPAEYSDRIFELFKRLHGKHEYSGTGIGLSIVKKIVEQHKGFIKASSSEGRGSTFSFWLPQR